MNAFLLICINNGTTYTEYERILAFHLIIKRHHHYPILVPPLHVFVPWCTESFQLPSTHQNGKLLALELLCRVYVVSQYNDDYQMDYTSLSQFYQLLHQCLLDTQDPYVMYKVLKSCSGGFFGAALPGSFLLYEDFLFSIEQFSSGLASSVRVSTARF